ncbi:hypothetical protein [Duganella sp. HH101]|uniref:hypothetical protein n=1 Tax=Duganella sp. HH101 TaxID=1781066 RepID=UPI000892E256|nr:hypothetical protein [Duganella sp. HH101]OEZ99930.1 hypothetical protein DUGA2_51000 [Duganella sp. HH101]
MPVQDDERERELVRMFNLDWDPAHQRAGVDALLKIDVDGRLCQFEVEVKSSTNTTVSTARDVGMEHIRKWRSMFFVIGFYSKEARRPELKHCLCLTPLDMEPWIAAIEAKILIDFRLAIRAAKRLVLEDLHDVCGAQDSYTLHNAKQLHKQQWTSEEYAAALDMDVNGSPRISPTKMLDILRLRSRYIAERGATLNNPHITKAHLDTFTGTDRVVSGPNWAEGVRKIARDFARAYPNHPAIATLQS